MPETTPDLARLEALARAAQEPCRHAQCFSWETCNHAPCHHCDAWHDLAKASLPALPWLLAQAREAERLREEARSNTDYFAAYVRRAETAETRLAAVERERDAASQRYVDETHRHEVTRMEWEGLNRAAEAISRKCETLTAALAKYGQHAHGCHAERVGPDCVACDEHGWHCTCGFDQAR